MVCKGYERALYHITACEEMIIHQRKSQKCEIFHPIFLASLLQKAGILIVD
jgi:hypothetical protein